MIFNSIAFLVFFIVIFLLYYFVFKERKSQNILLLAGSYFFYGYADLRLLPIVVVSTLLFYFLGLAMQRSQSDKKRALLSTIGIVFGVGLLVYFKYTNFFIQSFGDLLSAFGFNPNFCTLNIIAPLGISFYTFRLLSYIIDIKRGKEQATADLVAFSTYVAFFPTILSGPIDRSIALLPQFKFKREFNYSMAIDGTRQILCGLVKKMVIADAIAIAVGSLVSPEQSGSAILLGSVLYLFQLYADFSGYSDMAIGVGKLLGFKITINFNYPLFAQNIADFWRRWHISLTSWLTEYVFMPLNIALRNWGNMGMIMAIMINLFVVGIWHGANTTFALFGLYHGLLFIPLILSGAMFKKNKFKTTKLGFPTWRCFGNMVLTMMLVVVGLMIFRADSVTSFIELLDKMVSSSLFSIPRPFPRKPLLLVIALVIVEWKTRDREYALKIMPRNNVVRWVLYYLLVMCVILFASEQNQFVYFQF